MVRDKITEEIFYENALHVTLAVQVKRKLVVKITLPGVIGKLRLPDGERIAIRIVMGSPLVLFRDLREIRDEAQYFFLVEIGWHRWCFVYRTRRRLIYFVSLTSLIS
jgi:hypothetical protein